MNKKTLFIALSGILALPGLAFADNTIQSLGQNVISQAVWPIAQGVVVIFWIVTGLLFLLARGDPSKLTLAKKALLTSVAGTFIIILAFSAVGIIANIMGLAAPGQ